MSNKKRLAALLTAVAVLFVMLFSAFYIAAESNHNCVGEHCSICYQVKVCQNALKNLSLAVFIAVFSAVSVYILRKRISDGADSYFGCTLIMLKVKLSD